MILTFDTYYFEGKAKTVCVAFKNWGDEIPHAVYAENLGDVAEYESGQFYKRELPCILSLLQQVPLDGVELIIIDGFVYLNDDGKLGLGGHLYQALDARIPVMGVAKTNFATIEKLKRAVVRGDSNRALYVTAIGTDVDEAAANVSSMHGPFRIPTLLKLLDRLTKEE